MKIYISVDQNEYNTICRNIKIWIWFIYLFICNNKEKKYINSENILHTQDSLSIN